jgi:hypothetical protein
MRSLFPSEKRYNEKCRIRYTHSAASRARSPHDAFPLRSELRKQGKFRSLWNGMMTPAEKRSEEAAGEKRGRGGGESEAPDGEGRTGENARGFRIAAATVRPAKRARSSVFGIGSEEYAILYPDRTEAGQPGSAVSEPARFGWERRSVSSSYFMDRVKSWGTT